MEENKNNKINGWTEYGKLVLKELERLNAGQDKIREEMDNRFKEINTTLTGFKTTESEVKDLKAWKEKVTEVWSTTQMKQSKDEIYLQKNNWTKITGVVIGIQLVIGAIAFFISKII
tara:strand:+ start:11895 stop:12245 length:351 start_codon:yes stop_codon:yes gene_type:complete